MTLLNEYMILFRDDNSAYCPEFYMIYTDSEHYEEVRKIIVGNDVKLHSLISILVESNVPYHLIRLDEITSISRYMSNDLSVRAKTG